MSHSTPIQLALHQWYQLNKRELPWRSTSDPYKIWLSEVILQQTRVAQGLEYYEKFVSTYPTVQELANADQDEVLKLWQGLGYYSRARNLHTAAKQVMNDFQGIFPKEHTDLLKLKGVGAYTAAAVASISQNQAVAVVDGNVERVLSRLFNYQTAVNSTLGKKDIATLATEFLDINHAGTHNQAVMELGALVCTPKNPACNACPLSASCAANQKGIQLSLPVKNKTGKQRKRFFHYFWIENQEKVLLRKRPEGDIWHGLYEPLLFETADKSNERNQWAFLKETINYNENLKIQWDEGETKHILSHQVIFSKFHQVNLPKQTPFNLNEYAWVEKSELPNYPVSRLLERYLEERVL